MKRYGFVFARGGSKGVPGKNIKMLAGKPLIAWAIEAALETGLLDCVIVSTDSEEIAEVARSFGARTPFMRPAELGSDNSSEWLSWQHAIKWLADHGETFDEFVSLPATAPLRTSQDIALCVTEFEKGGCDLLLTCAEAQRHPMFNMYRENEAGLMEIYDRVEIPITRRQNAPPVFDGTTMAYISWPDYILANSFIWAGRVKGICFPRDHAIDIDEPLDFEIAEMILKKRCGGNARY